MARLIIETSMLVDAELTGSLATGAVGPTDDVAIAAVTAAELLVGVELADAQRRPDRAGYVAGIIERVFIEDYDLEVARVHAQLLAHTRRSGRRRGYHDLIIASTAAARDRTVITRDASGFAELPGVAVRIVE